LWGWGGREWDLPTWTEVAGAFAEDGIGGYCALDGVGEEEREGGSVVVKDDEALNTNFGLGGGLASDKISVLSGFEHVTRRNGHLQKIRNKKVAKSFEGHQKKNSLLEDSIFIQDKDWVRHPNPCSTIQVGTNHDVKKKKKEREQRNFSREQGLRIGIP
jgi:hypothetical protein